MIFKWVTNWYVKKVEKPAGTTFEGWQEWTERTKKNHPLLYFIFETCRKFVDLKKRRFRDFKYHLSQKYGNGYHILKLDVKRFKEPYNTERLFKYGWMDSDNQMELFMFQILVNYIEKEIGYENLKERITEGSDSASFHEKEAFDLYEWFINDYCDTTYKDNLYRDLYKKYPEHKEYLKRSPFSSKPPKTKREREYIKDRSIVHEKVRIYDEKMDEEMTENLIKLVKIRHSLWT